jgi:hypothetical protein
MVTSKALSVVATRISPQSIDSRLLSGARPDQDPAVGRRASQLVSERHRRDVAAGLRRLLEVAQRPQSRRLVPLRREAIAEARDQLLALAVELEDESDVQPRGVIYASRLVEDVSSPAYALSAEPEDLGRAVRHARTALVLT